MNTPAGPGDTEAHRQLLAASRALAQDLLVDPATMAYGLDRSYRMRPHLRVIGQAMAEVLAGRYDRLLVICPPQVGKSTLVAEWGSFWWLANRPGDDVIVTSYGLDLALGRSKRIRDLVAEHGHEYDLSLKDGSAAAHDWHLASGGHVRAVGVGGGLSGFSANCIEYSVEIQTRLGPMPIGAYVDSGCTAEVLSYDHASRKPVWAPVAATSVAERDIVEVVTSSGRAVRCTPDHRVYVVGRGYVSTTALEPGDVLRTTDGDVPLDLRAVREHVHSALGRDREGSAGGPSRDILFPVLRQRRPPNCADLQKLCPPSPEGHPVLLPRVPYRASQGDADLQQVRHAVQPYPLGRRKEGTAGLPARLLFEDMHGQSQCARTEMPGLRCDGGEGSSVLLRPVQGEGSRRTETHQEIARPHVPALRHDVPAVQQPGGVLLSRLREPGARAADGGPGQFPLQGRHLVREVVQVDAAPDPEAGQAPLCGVRDAGAVCDFHAVGEGAPAQHVSRAPHRREPGEQCTGKSDHVVQDVPRRTPQVGYDTVAVVHPLRGERFRVYDLQVEGTHNFFAGEILVHNCIIVDDPHKDRAEAESKRIRDAVHDWWSSTASKRLQPDVGAVAAIMTRWHPDDFAGRRLEEEGRVEEGGLWKVVHLPAIADPKFGPDPLGREPGEPLTHPKIPTRDRARLARWWEHVKRTSIIRDWHSLDQGDPQPSKGALVSEDLLRLLRNTTTAVEPQKVAVAVDPSGGGRDTAGIIGGFLGGDGRLWITHDRSGVMSSDAWSRAACQLAHETDAAIVYVESNYGGDLGLLAIRTAWAALVKEGDIPAGKLPPRVVAVRAKVSKLLRAEPIAQQMIEDRVRLRGVFTDLEREWATWMPTDPASPGRIDASVYLAYGLLPVPAAGHADASGAAALAAVDLTRQLRPGDMGR